MKHLSLLALSFVLLISAVACDKETGQFSDCIEIITNLDLYNNGPQDPTTEITEVYQEGSCLVVSYKFSGGCEEHDIKLVTDGTVSFSIPPMINLKVIHDNTDSCEALLQETREYDLNSLDIDKGIYELVIEGYEVKILVDFE